VSWLAVHTLLPVAVFWAGVSRLSVALLLRGLVAVGLVACAFGLVNGRLSLSPLSQLGFNVLVPAAVATSGALGGERRRVRSQEEGAAGGEQR
jgi:hypothetical protein